MNYMVSSWTITAGKCFALILHIFCKFISLREIANVSDTCLYLHFSCQLIFYASLNSMPPISIGPKIHKSLVFGLYWTVLKRFINTIHLHFYVCNLCDVVDDIYCQGWIGNHLFFSLTWIRLRTYDPSNLALEGVT